MRSKDITLSASLMAIYVAINLLGTVAPIKVSTIMQSALFGLFWPFFSTRLNLTFQGLRVGWNLIGMVRSAPKIVNYMKIQSIGGLALFEWVYGTFGTPIDLEAIEVLTALTKIEIGLNFWIFMAGFLVFFYSVVPYLFYRYFKAVGLFKRLPSF